MNKIEGIKYLLLIVPRIAKSSDYFREYLNSGSKECWDQFAMDVMLLFLNLSYICDNNLLEKKEINIILSCLNFDDMIFKHGDYTPEKREGQEKVLEIIWELKKII